MSVRADDLTGKAKWYLETLCSVVPNRRTGSPGNRAAVDLFADTVRGYGYEVDATPFECLDHIRGGVSLTRERETFEVQISPYSLGCDVVGPLVAASTVEELAHTECAGKILMIDGPLCAEQLAPKNYVFYNPERHQRIIALLEGRDPAAIITATGKNPEIAGALEPFPLIVDGDFDIPNVFCSEATGDSLAEAEGDTFRLKIDARRLPSKACNVVARRDGKSAAKIVFTAHIDAYEGSPGAIDNASGTVVMLLLAELLSNRGGGLGIEIVALNGEDHYSAGGQLDYLERFGGELEGVLLALNIDGVGYVRGRSAYSFYGCSPEIENHAQGVFGSSNELVQGDPWFSGDHMLFAQAEIPSISFTSEHAADLMRTVVHTALDNPTLVEANRLVRLARALDRFVRSLPGLW